MKERPIGTLTTWPRWAVIDGSRKRMVSAAAGRACLRRAVQFF